MKGYLLIRTRYGISREVIDDVHKSEEDCFIQGRSTFGWYDAIVELKIPNANMLSEIAHRLLHNQPDVTHIGTIVERT
jgi:hypothetical protein